MTKFTKTISCFSLAICAAIGLSFPGIAQDGPPLLAPATPASPVLTDCHQVLQGMQNRYNGYDSWRLVHMKITDETGAVKTRTIAAAHKNFGINRRLRSIVLDPAELKDVESYVHDNFEVGMADKVWVWLPSSKSVMDVKSEDLSQRLYGSDLAVGEMLIRQARDYDCKMLGTGVFQGFPVYKVYVNPRTENEVIRLGLRDGEVWVESETFMPMFSSFNADAPNEQRILETTNMRWVNGVFAPGNYRVTTMKEGRVVSFSEFTTEDETFNIGLPDSFFELGDLGKTDSAFRDYRAPAITN
jgi:Outer membrane lipoprotein-sorting protein